MITDDDPNELNGVGSIPAVHGQIDKYIDRFSQFRRSEVDLSELRMSVPGISEIIHSGAFRINLDGWYLYSRPFAPIIHREQRLP